MRRLLLAAALVALVVPGAVAAFTPTDPLVPSQWYLGQDRAFDFWPDVPILAPVRVAVIDSGIDEHHPDLEGRIAVSRSFVGSDRTDRQGHGTFVAGVIAAALDNGVGIAGIAFSAELVIAKVVQDDGTISPRVEADAIRWAADAGARVINLSIGGLRDPRVAERDTYSAVEQDAVAYAHRKGAVVVAAVGNGDEAPRTPWSYASYPSALPHVVGVGALGRNGTIPLFSNRDAIFVDLVAPGEGIVSTLPTALTAKRPGCPEQGYSPCGPPSFAAGEGTSFAAAQVSAAAALLLALRPELRPEQVAAVLERSAADATPATGCPSCATGRDPLSGWGRLDIGGSLAALAVAVALPEADQYESNDDAGERAATLWGLTREIDATIDFWDDQVDVYRLKLFKGQRLSATLEGAAGTDVNLLLWRPGTETVEGLGSRPREYRITQSATAGPNERVAYRATATGWYYLEVKTARPGSGAYALTVAKSVR